MSETVTVQMEADEAALDAMEYAALIRQLEREKDPRRRRPAEHMALMRLRLVRKEAIRDRYVRLLERKAGEAA